MGFGDLEYSAATAPRRPHPSRVALFSGNYNCIRDGANQALNRLVLHLQARGMEVRVYSPTVPQPAFDPAGALISVPSAPIPGRPEYRLSLGLTPHIRHELSAFDPDLIHLSAPDPLGHGALRLGKRLGIPVVSSLHTRFDAYLSYYGLGAIAGLARSYLNGFYRRCDHVLVPNAAIGDELSALGLGGRVTVWPRGVDRDVFDPARRDAAWRRSLGFAADELVLLYFGRIVREKGLELFARVAELVRASGRRLGVLVVGEGPHRASLAKRLPDARFVGHLSGQALGAAVASADVLLHPSLTEAFGNVTLEAMAAGLAVVCADQPSNRAMVVNDTTGLLCPSGTPEAYAAAVCSLIDDPVGTGRLRRAAAAASARFSWEDSLAVVSSAYASVLYDRAA